MLCQHPWTVPFGSCPIGINMTCKTCLAERWHLCTAFNASHAPQFRRPRVDAVTVGCVAIHLVHADVLLLHLHDTHQLRLLSKLLHARGRQCSMQRSKFSHCPISKPIVAPQHGPDSPPRQRRTSSAPRPSSPTNNVPASAVVFCCFLLTWLLLGAPLVLSCYCRLTFLVRASDLELDLASSISMTLQFPSACRTP